MTAPVAVTLSVITARQSTKQRAPVSVRNTRPEVDVNASPDTLGSIVQSMCKLIKPKLNKQYCVTTFYILFINFTFLSYAIVRVEPVASFMMLDIKDSLAVIFVAYQCIFYLDKSLLEQKRIKAAIRFHDFIIQKFTQKVSFRL